MADQARNARHRYFAIRSADRSHFLRSCHGLLHVSSDTQSLRCIERAPSPGALAGSPVLLHDGTHHDPRHAARCGLGRRTLLSRARTRWRPLGRMVGRRHMHGYWPALEVLDWSARSGRPLVHRYGPAVAALVAALETV